MPSVVHDLRELAELTVGERLHGEPGFVLLNHVVDAHRMEGAIEWIDVLNLCAARGAVAIDAIEDSP